MSNSTSKNKVLMGRVYANMWNEGNPALASELFTRPEGVERFVREFLLSFPDLQHTVEEMIQEGDRVAVRFSAAGTHLGHWLQFPASGRRIHYSGLTLARISGNKIIEHVTWWDRASLMEQITSASENPAL